MHHVNEPGARSASLQGDDPARSISAELRARCDARELQENAPCAREATQSDRTTARDAAHARAGDGTAFEQLVREYGAWVEAIAFSILRNHDDALDVSQEVWIKVSARLPQLRDPDRFRAWLRTVVRNTALHEIAARRTRTRHTGAVDSETLASLPGGSDELPGRALERREQLIDVHRALRHLTARDRELLYLRAIEGLPYEQAARAVGMTRNAAEVRVHRARERLRRSLLASGSAAVAI